MIDAITESGEIVPTGNDWINSLDCIGLSEEGMIWLYWAQVEATMQSMKAMENNPLQHKQVEFKDTEPGCSAVKKAENCTR